MGALLAAALLALLLLKKLYRITLLTLLVLALGLTLAVMRPPWAPGCLFDLPDGSTLGAVMDCMAPENWGANAVRGT